MKRVFVLVRYLTLSIGVSCTTPYDINQIAAPTVIATSSEPVFNLNIDASNVYWTTHEDGAGRGAIMKAPINGGPSTPLATGQSEALAVGATHVFWTKSGGGTSGGGAVVKVPITGGAPGVLASGLRTPWRITVDATHVYWTEAETAGAVMKVPIEGGTPIKLATARRPFGVAVDDSSVYWSTDGYGDPAGGSIVKVALDGGEPVILVTGLSNPQSLAVDATHVYWTTEGTNNFEGGNIMRVPIGGGMPTTLATSQYGPQNVVLDAQQAYWTTIKKNVANDQEDASLRTASVRTVPVGGGDPFAILFTVPDGHFGLVAVDAAYIYWEYYVTGDQNYSIVRFAK